MSPDIYNCRLNSLNIVISLINILFAAIDWVIGKDNDKAYVTVEQLDNLCLVLSCFILVWGFKKLISVVPSDQHLVNKGMIIWHIIAYFFIVTAIVVQGFFLGTGSPEKFEIITCFVQVINLACTVILALIVD